jgi:site-specific DNA-methyltransferase (adenine-specific)
MKVNSESKRTMHYFVNGDSRSLAFVKDESVHLVVTSPPYWTLKQYNDQKGQLGHIEDYEEFLRELSKVWAECHRVLVPGGRLVCVVGDVCLARRKFGRHLVVPLHADIMVTCRKLGFDNLNPILWMKIANASFEVANGTGFLGKPYEPNAIIKNDMEFILMERKPGGYRQPTEDQRQRSRISKKDYDEWFRQSWTLTGASTKDHPAPFPLEIANRLVRMFSFVDDTVLDPFGGTGTTALAALKADRNSISVEVDACYWKDGVKRVEREGRGLYEEFELHACTASGLEPAAIPASSAEPPRTVRPVRALTAAPSR